MRRSTLFMLLAGAGAAAFNYTPQAAAWLTIGRDQGYIPESVPSEVTDPTLFPALGLAMVLSTAVWLARKAMGFIGASPMKTAVVVQVVEQTIQDRGREIITGRKRRAEIREEIAHADAEREELAREYAANEKDRQELAVMCAMADTDVLTAERQLNKTESAREDFRKKHAANISRGMEINSRLIALGAAKSELVEEQKQLS